jgi:hypothetical protein
MQRRTVLATVGSALLATAGCVSNSNGDDQEPADGNDPEDDRSSDDPSDDTTPEQTPIDDTPPDGTPGSDPDEGDGAGASFGECPSFADGVDQTVCSHTGSNTGVYPAVSQEVFTPTTGDNSVETLEITLHNVSGSRFGLNPHDWAIKRQTADGWTHVAPEEYVEPWYTLEPDETYTWRLSVETHPTPQGDQTMAIMEDLDSGTYAFRVTGILDESPADAKDSDEKTTIECVALFNVNRS